LFVLLLRFCWCRLCGAVGFCWRQGKVGASPCAPQRGPPKRVVQEGSQTHAAVSSASPLGWNTGALSARFKSMTDRELSDAIVIIPDRLYWVALHTAPKVSGGWKTSAVPSPHYFSIDNDHIYEPFFADFGPLNLSHVYKFCKTLEAKLGDPAFEDKRIIHYCTHDPKKRANAAFLICCYQVVVLGRSADVAYQPFAGIYPPFLLFRDATCGVCTFHLTILDCLKGLEKAIEVRWFDWNHFDCESYEFFEKVENGDMNWIIPGKFLAFAGPCPTPTDADGFSASTPEDYCPIFQDAGVGLVVRLNKKQYDRRRFIDYGIKHVDLYFLDGSCPSRDIIGKFLHIAENERGAMAVHCKAGLGRTGTLIGLYAMKHFQWQARAWIGWNRICRPGSILGPQQQFLIEMQAEMQQAGANLRISSLGVTEEEKALSAQFGAMSVSRPQAESREDVGQGERLVNAKRTQSIATPTGTVRMNCTPFGEASLRDGSRLLLAPHPATNFRPLAPAPLVGRSLRTIFANKV